MSEEKEWYLPGPSIMEFHRSTHRIRVLIGGRGCGKTTGVGVETALKHGWRYAGARIYVLRKTQQANQDTTLETFEIVFRNAGTGYVDTGVSLFKKMEGGRQFRIPSAKAVELYNNWQLANPGATKSEKIRWLDSVGERYCSFILFAGVPTSSLRATRFRGFEASLIVLVEADQFDREDVDLAMACLRWKGADPKDCDEKGYLKDQGLILDTNPPSPRHWIAKWEEEAKGYPDDNYIKFWHIRTEENRTNLPPNYIEDLTRQYANNDAMFRRMLLGEYAEAFDGSPVFWAFNSAHVKCDLPFVKGAYLLVGWDFGATANANVFSCYWEKDGYEYIWDLHEYYAEETDTEIQCREVGKILEDVFDFHNDRRFCAGILHFCDPAGAQKRDTGDSLSVLRTYGFHPGYRRAGLQESLTAYNRFLEMRDAKGDPCYRIDSAGCPKLHAGSAGGYRYPSEGEPGFGGDTPGKGPFFGNFDHLADASRYQKLGVLRIMKVGMDKKPNAGRLFAKRRLNKLRKWR